MKNSDKLKESREDPEPFLQGEVLFERKRNNLKHQERYREITATDSRQDRRKRNKNPQIQIEKNKKTTKDIEKIRKTTYLI